jgi:hypothetical protein
MKKIVVLLMLSSAFFNVTYAQTAAKAAYVEIGGPGLLSANFDMRFASKEDGAGFRVGVGAFSVNSASVVTVPLGLNYLIGKDKKNYFEVGAGFTYLNVSEKNTKTSKNFKSSFGDVTLGYRWLLRREVSFLKRR